MNSVKTEVTPKFPEIERHTARVKFKRRLDVIEMFMYVFLDGTAEQIREKRLELENGRHLLIDQDAIARCDAMIRAFTAQLHIIPHERSLQRHFSTDSA